MVIELTLSQCTQEHLNLSTLGCGMIEFIFADADWLGNYSLISWEHKTLI
jgi:hypothetical protein